MRNSPRPPQNPNELDKETLDFINRRIAGWEAMKDSSIPYDDRVQAMSIELERDLQHSLREMTQRFGSVPSAEDDLESEISPNAEVISKDIDVLEALDPTEDEFELTLAAICADRIKFYIEIRNEYLKARNIRNPLN